MAIPEEDVARVRAATDLAALVAEHSTLKRVGRSLVALCPFHQENSPSLSINAAEGLYYCFGCQASGNAIQFVQAVDGVDFVEAVERLAARAGIAIRHDGKGSAAARADHDRRQAMFDAVAAAVDFYHDRLLSGRDSGPARHYLRSRGYDGEVVRQFRLGWAPAGWDELTRALNMPQRVLKEAGLAFVNNAGKAQDIFRGRIIFPILDTSGRPIALGGRVLPVEAGGSGAPGPKYRNSAESAIYSKRRTLYGLNWAKGALVHTSEVIVCEGYTDVIAFFTAGVPRAVATCGTALTDEHLKVLGSFVKRVVLSFDADAAGQSAAARIYESERRHGLEVAVAALPAGKDPGDLGRDDPEALRHSVETAVPFLAFRIDRAIGAADLRTAEGRARAAEGAVAAIAEHPNQLVRDQYLVSVADRTRIELESLRKLLDDATSRLAREHSSGGPRTGSRTAQGDSGRARGGREADEPLPRDPEGGAADAEPVDRRTAPAQSGANGTGSRHGGKPAPGWRPERLALRLAVHKPEEIAPYLHEALFADELHRATYRALGSASSLHEAIDDADDDVADLLRRLAVEEPADEVDGAMIQLSRVAGERALADLERQARLAGTAGDSQRIAEISERTDWVHHAIALLSEDGAGAADAKPLLAWLVQRDGEGV